MIEFFIMLCKQFNLRPFLLVLNAYNHKAMNLLTKEIKASETK